MPRLAVFTFGNLHGKQGDDHPGARGFWEAVPSVFSALEAAPGFLERSAVDASWGAWTTPPLGDGREVQTLSLWVDLESLFAAAYGGDHLDAMKKRKDWFKEEGYPSSVLWWVHDDHRPTWAEGRDRLLLLHENGSAPAAFSFRQPFDPDGNATRVDHTRAKTLTPGVEA